MGFWTSIFGLNEDLAAGAAANDKLIELNQQAYAEGRISLDQYNQTAGRLGSDAQMFTQEAAGAAIQQDFNAGLEEGRQNIKGFIGGGLGKIFGTVPWWVWILALAGLGIYLAGPLIRKRLAA